jgi:tRNA G18 (ribose-2'-O)-methylase SpoU
MRKLQNDELNRLSVDEFKKAKKTPIVVVLDNIRSFNNVGSAFRTADAFRIEAVYLCGITARPPHREIHKTALGATESVSWKYFKKTEEALSELAGMDYEIISIEQTDNSIMLNNFKPSGNNKYAFVFGNEVHGVDDKVIQMSNTVIEIPQTGTKHSLNITVSVGIVLWDFYSKINSNTI